MVQKLSLLLSLFFVIFISSLSAEVVDNAGFFSPAAVRSANQQIAQTKRTTGKELVVETITSLNGENPDQYAIARARTRKVNGVYVLLAKKERKINIRVGSRTRQIFGSFEMGNLKLKFTENFKRKQYDTGLTEAVMYYSGVFQNGQKNARTPPVQTGNQPKQANQKSSGGSSMFKWIIIGLILFLAFRLITSLLARGRGGQQMGGGYGNGGGYGQNGGMGFMGTLLTGMLGAAAGSWLYNQFTDNDSSLSASDSFDNSADMSSYSDNASWAAEDDYSDYSAGDSGGFDSGGGFDDGGSDW